MKAPFGTATTLTLVLWAGLWALAEAALTAETLARDVKRVESVREIKDVQRMFGQLAQYGRWSEMAGLFADDGVLRWGSGKAGVNILSDKDAVSVAGPAAIEDWLRSDAGNMDGVRPGSLHTLVNEMPLVSLSADGKSAKGRWHALRLMGDGAGATRIEGGIFENEYVLTADEKDGDLWKISLLRYYPMFAGDYKNGWKNAGGDNLPIVPYHFTPDEAGMPIPLSLPAQGNVTLGGSMGMGMGMMTRQSSSPDLDDLAYRISQMNEEDEVRNLQHAYGYYVDRRMWTDVLDLFATNGTISIDGETYTGLAAIREALEKMGPEGLAHGILNDRLIFESIVQIGDDGQAATTRGLEMGMIGDVDAKTASWEFNVFRNNFVRDPDSGIWRIKDLTFTRLMLANYSAGWGDGGIERPTAATSSPSPFLDVLGRASKTQRPKGWRAPWQLANNSTQADILADLRRRLERAAAFDETENVSAAYGYYADDIRCDKFAALHAANGFKESPGTGWYKTPARIEGACKSRYGNGAADAVARRPNVPFHWRPQPVIIVSADGRSASLRARILQLGTAKSSTGGFAGVYGFNGGMYHDQFVLEPQTPANNDSNPPARRKLWCLTIDEFYWQSSSWAGGWASLDQTSNSTSASTSASAPAPGVERTRRGADHSHPLGSTPPSPPRRRQSSDYPPDLSLKDPALMEREIGFAGGPTAVVAWPQIQRMWFSYRNPVTGRVPDDNRIDRNSNSDNITSNGSSYWGAGLRPVPYGEDGLGA